MSKRSAPYFLKLLSVLAAAAVSWEPVNIEDPPGVAGSELTAIALGERAGPAGTRHRMQQRKDAMRKIPVAWAAAGALGMLRRGNGAPWGSRRAGFGPLLATAMVVLGLAGAAPAMASTAPSMTANGNDVNIAVEGASHSLLFFWAASGTSTWNKQTVAGKGTAFSAPSMTLDVKDVDIAVEGPNNTLLYFWAVNGSSTWHKETVAGTGSTYSAPSITPDSPDIDIAAEGVSGSLYFYWAVNGSGTWNLEQVAPSGTVG